MKTLLCTLAVSLAAVTASAGQWSGPPTSEPAAGSQPPASGWSVTPALSVSRTFDDNVLLHGPGDSQDRDYINVINPRAEVNYKGQRSEVALRWPL